MKLESLDKCVIRGGCGVFERGMALMRLLEKKESGLRGVRTGVMGARGVWRWDGEHEWL